MGAIRNRIVGNTIANYAGAFALVASPLICLPMYLHLLGDEQWGLIGFVSTLQSLAALLDAGMGQVLVREFAVRLAGEQTKQAAARLLGSCERFYWLAGAIAAVLVIAFSAPIAHRWLDISESYQTVGQITIAGAGVLCALQLPALLYRGVLIAAEDQVKLNSVLVTGSILRFGGGVAAVAIYPSVVSYLGWHIFSFALEVFARSHFAWRAVGGRRELSTAAALSELKGVMGRMSVWTAGATIGAITWQIDKSILAAMRPVAELTPYFIASQLASGSQQLFYPVVTALLPILIRLDGGREARSKTQFGLALTLLGLCAVLAAGTMLFGNTLLGLWLGEQRAIDVMPLFSMLLVGVTCSVLSNVGYINWLARDRRFRLLVTNILALLVVVVSTPLLVPRMGVVGAAVALFLGQLVILLSSLDWIRDAFRERLEPEMADPS